MRDCCYSQCKTFAMPVTASKANEDPLKLPGSEAAKNLAGSVRQQGISPSFGRKTPLQFYKP